MQRLLIFLSLILVPFFLRAQSPAEYMALVWAKKDVPGFLIPYKLEAEPIGRLGAIGKPNVLQGTWCIPVINTSMKGKPKLELRKVGLGMGQFLIDQGAISTSFYPKNLDGDLVEDPNGLGNVACIRSKSGLRKLVGVVGATASYEFPFTMQAYEDISPAFEGKGKLFFASNRPGGQGGWDIWYAERENGIWGMAQPMGPGVNTPGDEMNPSIGADGKFYFASNGHPGGYGGYDLYSLENKVMTHLTYPVNTVFDDFSITRLSSFQYICSNRPRETQLEQGPTQLYRIQPKGTFKSRVVHARSGKYMGNIPVQITQDGKYAFVSSDSLGWLEFYVNPGESYQLRVAIEGYDPVLFEKVNVEKALPVISLTEKEYCMVTLNVMENGRTSSSLPWVSFYKNGIFLDSMQVGANGVLMRDLAPQNAYLAKVFLPGYPSQEFAFTAGKSGKQNHSKTLYFGLAVGEFVRVATKDPENSAVSGVKIELLLNNEPYMSVAPAITDPSGHASVLLPGKSAFTFLGFRDDMFGWTKYETAEIERRIDTVDVKVRMEFLELGKVILSFMATIDPIALQGGKQEEFQLALLLLEKYPGMILELGVHTDSRGATAENLRRSKQAAEFAADYFYLKGIPKNRILPKGYGETKLLNECADGVNCPETSHNLNNRVEFRIIQR